MTVLEFAAGHFNHAAVIVLMMTGLFAVLSSGNLVKRLIGLALFQTSIGLFYISMGKVAGGRPPILDAGTGGAATIPTPAPAGAGAYITPPAGLGPDGVIDGIYSNPLPHVLILTAIVVGVATLAVGLALVVRIREAFGTIEEDELQAAAGDAETAA